VNAGNKQEMQAFIQQSKKNSQTVVQLSLPNLKLLVADQKFLNDIYNCFLNDLIMWLPSPVPPIESALNLFYDAQNNPTIFASSGLAGSKLYHFDWHLLPKGSDLNGFTFHWSNLSIHKYYHIKTLRTYFH
jgi:hypothetical protein